MRVEEARKLNLRGEPMDRKQLDGMFSSTPQPKRTSKQIAVVEDGAGQEVRFETSETTIKDPEHGWTTTKIVEPLILGSGHKVNSHEEIAGTCCVDGVLVCKSCLIHSCCKCQKLVCTVHAKTTDDEIVCEPCYKEGKWKRVILAIMWPFIEKVKEE